MCKLLKCCLALVAISFAFAGCSDGIVENSELDIIASGVEPADVQAWEDKVDADFKAILDALGTENEIPMMQAFDDKYGTNMVEELYSFSEARSGSSKGGSDKYTALTDMPFKVDGAVYISGGTSDLVGTVVDWVSPKTFDGGYYHGAVLDMDKYDPYNEDTYCLQTAISRGAGYETADIWRHKVNACVLNPNFSVNKSKLDSAQAAADYYCTMNVDRTNYGFFKGAVNIFDVVTKSDMETWYCTKVVWYVWNKYGIDIDSNSSRIDFTTSGLYTLVKDFYAVRYFYSAAKRQAAVDDYIVDARKNIVLAEEILLSPYFNKVYENIRER